MNFKSRKTIVLIVAVLVSILGFAKTNFQLEGNPAEAVGAIGIALLYIFGQSKIDIKKAYAAIKDQNKFRDPTFWIALIGVIIAPINSVLGANIPVEAIQGFAAVIIPIILGVIFKKTPSTPIV